MTIIGQDKFSVIFGIIEKKPNFVSCDDLKFKMDKVSNYGQLEKKVHQRYKITIKIKILNYPHCQNWPKLSPDGPKMTNFGPIYVNPSPVKSRGII